MAVRSEPTTSSPVLKFHRPGETVHGYGILDAKWLKLRDCRGWMMLASETYGVLLAESSSR